MTNTNPKEAGRLMQMAQETVDCRGLAYEHPSIQTSRGFAQAGQFSRGS